jgi:hypothetical protein
LRPTAHQGELTGYAAALEDVWVGVLPALAELERVAAEPSDRLATADLDGLRYALHRAAELTGGLSAPPGADGTHGELAEALAGAREATAAVAVTRDEDGPWAAEQLVWEWRGALFAVRLARHRLRVPMPAEPVVHAPQASASGITRPLAATIAVVLGALGVLAGALTEQWPLWSAGVGLVLASLLVQHERP